MATAYASGPNAGKSRFDGALQPLIGIALNQNRLFNLCVVRIYSIRFGEFAAADRFDAVNRRRSDLHPIR